ncbi:MAG: hypothetical protein ACTSX7_01835 [Alphaproteobacteria bacterium]
MYRDKTLIPTEAIRLAALGTLEMTPMRFSALARDVRAFASRIAGPSLDILGNSLELLRLEGLVATVEESAPEDPVVAITPAGKTALVGLLCANVRSPVDGVSKLILALKLRFMHLLDEADREAQLELILEASESEILRLRDLRQRHRNEPGQLCAWLDLELAQAEERIAWLAALSQS